MLEIAQHVQSFLHKHDRPPVSLHEEMVKRREKEAREESLRKYQQLELMRKQDEKEKEQIEKELQRRQAEVMEKVKQWQESEESSGSNDSLLDIVYDQELKPFTNALLPAKESSDKNKDINILRGKCLGDSALGGYTVYGGMDCDTGQLVVLYEWTILFKAASKKGDTRRMKQVSSIKQEFDSLIEKNIKHNCLVNYLSMRHQVTNQSIIVEIALEHINGGNLTGVLRNNHVGPYSLQTLHYFSKQLLEGLSYLHLQGIVHNDLRPSLVFVDPDEGAKLAGYTIVKRLSDLSKFTGRIRNGDEGVWSVGFSDGRGGKKSDIFKMVLVIRMMLAELAMCYFLIHKVVIKISGIKNI
jgi:translation initiation factor 2-alpha kinase 4